MAKRSMVGDVALPGLEDALLPVDVRPGGTDMTDEKTYNASVLFRDHPRVFKSACTLLFKNGLSERSVAAALYLSVNTVRAIRDMVTTSPTTDQAAAAFFIKSRISNARKVAQLRALEVIEDRLENTKEVSKISVDTLLSVVSTIDKIERPTEELKKSTKDDDVYDVSADVFDEVIDGLNKEKKSARDDSGVDGCKKVSESAAGDAAKCSTENVVFPSNSHPH